MDIKFNIQASNSFGSGIPPSGMRPPSSAHAALSQNAQTAARATTFFSDEGQNRTDRLTISKGMLDNGREKPPLSAAVPTTTKSVTIEFDRQSHSTVVKFMDREGNVVTQMPPQQYLRTLQLMGSTEALAIQGVSNEARMMMGTGSLVSKKV